MNELKIMFSLVFFRGEDNAGDEEKKGIFFKIPFVPPGFVLILRFTVNHQ